MAKVKQFIQEVELILLAMYTKIGIDKPINHDEILMFVANDIQETADPEKWHDGDVAIAFRRWIESGATMILNHKTDQCTNQSILIEDFKRRLKNVNELIDNFKSNGSTNDVKKETRLKTKASDYRFFISELEREIPTGLVDQCTNGIYVSDILKNKTKTVVLCASCNSDDVTIKGVNKGFCLICGKDVNTYKTVLKTTAKVIGYQVLGAMNTKYEGDIHPKMDASFCVYNLKQAQKMIANDTENWLIVSVWTGDIEEPTFMFNGNPDNCH